ncbi:MAG: GNAT family N-acetyltransferase [Candidatus Zixiibacteriota bacterium]|nr:MAG: GNAT family N-acetyltransferase [candidate division Zixibacteria bacterium]
MSPDIAHTLPGGLERNPYTLQVYDPARDKEAWDKALAQTCNATLFHLHEFLDYHPPGRFQNHHLLFRVGEEARVLMTGAIRATDRGPALVSYPGASYGGPAYPAGLSFTQAHHLVNLLLRHTRQEGFKTVTITPTPAIYSGWPGDVLEFHLFKSGFRYLRREITQAIPLDYPDGDIFSTLCNKTRTAVRKAVKEGLTVDQDLPLTDANLETFYPLLWDNRQRLGVTPTHSLDELKRLRDLIPGKLMLSLVRFQGRAVAGILNFGTNDRVLLIFYVCHDWEYQEHRPVPLLIYDTMQWAHRRGYRYLDFGTSTLNMEPNWGLLKFKENFGSRGWFRDTFTIDL